MAEEKQAAPERGRIVHGEDPDRFYCPFEGCSRSFAELWRLKVHFRAPPDVRGSGKERGHGTELKFCPKCGKELKPGKHHVGCAAGKSAPRQAAKRRRNATSSEDELSGNQSSHSSSWQRLVDSAVARRRTRTRGPKEEANAEESMLLVKENDAVRQTTCRVDTMEDIKVSDGLFTAGKGAATLNSDLLPNLMDTAEGLRSDAEMRELQEVEGLMGELEHLPSPPPIPVDWEIGGDGGLGGQGFLFDFGQFDAERSRRQSSLPTGGLQKNQSPDALIPHTTAVSAMNPNDISTPSDDYIWQVLFASPTDEVPKRVTAHMHNPASHNANLETLEDVGAYDPVYKTILPGGGGGTGAGQGGPGGAAGKKKKVTVTYEVGDDGKWNALDVKHEEQSDKK